VVCFILAKRGKEWGAAGCGVLQVHLLGEQTSQLFTRSSLLLAVTLECWSNLEMKINK